MTCAARFAVALLIALMIAGGPYAHAAGPGSGGQSGHGGFGGHGAFGGRASGGHSGHGGHGGSSSGGVGHSVAHSLGHIFGHHGKGPALGREGNAPDNSPTVTFGAVTRPTAPKFFAIASRSFHRRHANDFPFGDRFLRFHGRRGFGFDGCGGFSFPRHGVFFGDGFNCFGAGFFFDPFFFTSFSDSFVQGDAPEALQAGSQAAQLAGEVELGADADSGAQQQATNDALGITGEPKKDAPVTLMQLHDGSMYGLTDYWLEGALLHYKTTYGGENSIPLDRVDLQQTSQLNAARGIVFDPKIKNP